MYLNNGEVKKASDCFKNCITIDKNNAIAYSNLGVCYKKMGKVKDAI